MIPRASITAWRAKAPWASDAQVEQDLVLSRAIVEIFSEPLLSRELAFRGGTALHKLFLEPPVRYSEDIDLVQVNSGPFGPVLDALRAQLDPWLGKPTRERAQRGTKLIYRFESEIPPITRLRLKVEINTREHFAVDGPQLKRFAVDNLWFNGATDVVTYTLEELLGTKLRALYQRKKGRDLLDLAVAFARTPGLDGERIVRCFDRYMSFDNTSVSRAVYDDNLTAKLDDPAFVGDIEPLLATMVNSTWKVDAAWDDLFRVRRGERPIQCPRGRSAFAPNPVHTPEMSCRCSGPDRACLEDATTLPVEKPEVPRVVSSNSNRNRSASRLSA